MFRSMKWKAYTVEIVEDEESQVEVVCKIGDFAIHEEYDSETLKNDIAYIRFPVPITFSKHEFVFT